MDCKNHPTKIYLKKVCLIFWTFLYLQVPTSETLTSRQDRVSRAYGVNEDPGLAGKQMAAGDDMPGGHMAAGGAVRRSNDGGKTHTYTHTNWNSWTEAEVTSASLRGSAQLL